MHEHVEGGIITYSMQTEAIGRGHRLTKREPIRHYFDVEARFAVLGEFARTLEGRDG